jgi:AcrR family transcriptional regulator
VTGDTAFQRARRPEQKQQRQDAILDAARRLALRDGVRAVTLTDIADEVGIHKSALLRYFETREQIFLELAAQEWRGWAAALHAGLDAVPPGGPGSADLVADVVAGSFARRPLLCDLIPHTALNLERHVSPEAVRRYKLTSLGAIRDVAGIIQRVRPDLSEGECLEFISAMASLAGATWQIANPPPVLAELYAADPRLASACVDLLPRLRRTAEILLAGLIPSRNPPPGGPPPRA